MQITQIYVCQLCGLYVLHSLNLLTFWKVERKSESRAIMSDSLWPHAGQWNSPGQNTGVGSLFLLQGIFPTQGLNSGLPHCRQILHQLSRQGSPRILEWVVYPFSGRSSWPRNQTGVSFIAGRFFTSWAAREALRLVCNWIQADPWTTWVCTVRVHLHRRFFFSK